MKKPNASNGFMEKRCGDKVGTEWGQSGDIKRMKKRIHSFIHKNLLFLPFFSFSDSNPCPLIWHE